MNTKLLMGSSAVLMGVMGLAGNFLPQEMLTALSLPSAGLHAVLVQLLGALFLGFAMVNWTAKDSLIGGIYNRPVALGNLMHFTVGAFTMVRAVMAAHSPGLIVMAILYVLFAVAFGIIVFGSPVKSPTD